MFGGWKTWRFAGPKIEFRAVSPAAMADKHSDRARFGTARCYATR
jgi:hypothetical protein